jgi:hypothetical protein
MLNQHIGVQQAKVAVFINHENAVVRMRFAYSISY